MIADALTPEDRVEYLKRGKAPETWGPDFLPVGRLKNERVGYPTQKSLALLDRIIRASSNERETTGCDPFCGCATACMAANRLGRQWVGIDLSPLAAQLVEIRVHREGVLLFKAMLNKLPSLASAKRSRWAKCQADFWVMPRSRCSFIEDTLLSDVAIRKMAMPHLSKPSLDDSMTVLVRTLIP